MLPFTFKFNVRSPLNEETQRKIAEYEKRKKIAHPGGGSSYIRDNVAQILNDAQRGASKDGKRKHKQLLNRRVNTRKSQG